MISDKPVSEMTHQEQLELLREIKEAAEASSERLKTLLIWFLTETKRTIDED